MAANCWAFFNWLRICHLSLFIHICPARNLVEREVSRSAYRCDVAFLMFPSHHCDTFICFMTKIVTRLLLYKPTENLVILWTGSRVLKRQIPKQRKTANSIKYLKFVLIRSNKMQQYADIYVLQNHSACFGYPSHPSSGVQKTVTAAYGTGHSIWATTFLHRGL